jgi:hypothetical protein
MLVAENTVKHFPSTNQPRMQSSSGIDLAHASTAQTEAIADIYKKFHVSDAQLATLITRMKEEMQIGLVEDDASDLKMIPSFVTGIERGVMFLPLKNSEIQWIDFVHVLRLPHWPRTRRLSGFGN